jgi:hypothetical protein
MRTHLKLALSSRLPRLKPLLKEGIEMPSKDVRDAREGFTFGCDPEAFVFYNDKPVTAAGLLPGTKSEPAPLVSGGYVQVDGMAAEFNIPPVSTFRDFNKYIDSTIKEIEKMLPKGHELRFVPSVTFDKETFDASPDEAKELGCSPDYNAWEGKVNPPPKDPDNPYLRTAAGHIHLGWTSDADCFDPQHVMNCRDLVKQLDWFIGGWSLKMDTDPTRRRLYGRAGACRIKDYGVEYRVPSNFWVNSRDRRLAVWNRMQEAIDVMAKNCIADRADFYNDLLVESINQTSLRSELENAYAYPLASIERVAPAKRARTSKSVFGSQFQNYIMADTGTSF